MSDYETRAKNFGFATKEELNDALQPGKHAVILDVRTDEEIDASGTFEKPGIATWMHSKCTATACDVLSVNAEKMLPHKEGPIVIYCRSGRRANTAQKILEAKGYTNLLNAGGYDDILNMGL